ncbi:hypothetical protein ARMGADRAFT_1077775 [Armillaria gallica]|uniref:Uncharacterized protein n=1 Tax=Armillaria gallica TaxID=47427 RepID=A0A2H3E372_ARMGA|nr:hypothetical protein ARMGADRAFT_1077775 [Armillaria gallica]
MAKSTNSECTEPGGSSMETFYNKYYVPDDDAKLEDNSDSEADEHSSNEDNPPEDIDMDNDQEEDCAQLLDEAISWEEERTSQQKQKPQKTLSPMAAHDHQFLLCFIITERC